MGKFPFYFREFFAIFIVSIISKTTIMEYANTTEEYLDRVESGKPVRSVIMLGITETHEKVIQFLSMRLLRLFHEQLGDIPEDGPVGDDVKKSAEKIIKEETKQYEDILNLADIQVEEAARLAFSIHRFGPTVFFDSLDVSSKLQVVEVTIQWEDYDTKEVMWGLPYWVEIRQSAWTDIGELADALDGLEDQAKELYRRVDDEELSDGGYCAGAHDYISAAIDDLAEARNRMREELS